MIRYLSPLLLGLSVSLGTIHGDERALAAINGSGGELAAEGKMAPGKLQLDGEAAFALVRDAKDQVLIAGSATDTGRALVFGHGSFLKHGTNGENPALTEWIHRSLRWLSGGQETPVIGLQPDSPIIRDAARSLEEAGFTVELFAPAELPGKAVNAYCVAGQDANLSDADIAALNGFLGSGGGIAVLATPWAFAKKYPEFGAEFPGNRILAGTGIQFLARGYASSRPFTLVPSSLDPTELTRMAPEDRSPASEEKSDLEELLERTFPLPDFPPLDELVEGWKNVPARAFPPQVTVNVALEYQNRAGAKKTAPAGHQIQPLEVRDGRLLVGFEEMRALVAIDDTDFKTRVETLYQEGIARAKAGVLAQREEMRAEVASLSEKAADSGPMKPVTRTALSSRIGASYGKEYRGDYLPEIQNGKNLTDRHEIAMGPIGGKVEVYYDKKEARILDLWENGPGARSGLEVGDLLTEINGKPFQIYGSKSADGPGGVPEQLGLAMVEAQAGQPLELTVERAEREEKIRVELPALPPFSETFPANCERSSALVEAAAQYLADNQNEQGLWRSNDYSAAWCALALLATGDPKYSREIRDAARAFAEEYAFSSTPSREELISAGGDARNNWKVCMVGIFLGEYYLATGDEKVRDALMHCCQRMEARTHPENGRMGHSQNQLPYSEKGLVIINVHAHLMWALAAQSQAMEWNWDPWDLSYQAVALSIGNDNGVGYNFSARGGAQCGSRTGSMVTAQVLADRDTSDARRISSWLEENYHQFPNTHAMTSLGLIYGVMGLKNSSESSYRKCMDDYRWMFSLVQPANLEHGSYYYGQRKNHGGDGYCNRRLVGNYTTIMMLTSHRNDTLWMFGNRERNWYQ